MSEREIMTRGCPYHEESSDVNRGAMWKDLNGVLQNTVDALVDEATMSKDEFPDYAVSLPIREMPMPIFPPTKSTHLLQDANGRFDRTVAVALETRYELSDVQPLYVPIGQRDIENAKKTAAAAGWLVSLVEREAVQEVINEQSRQHASVIRAHTFLGMEREDTHEALHANMQQAVTIVAGSLRLLTAETPADMIESTERQLVEHKKTEELARRIGSGAVSTLIRNGAYIEQPLTDHGDFSPELEQYITRTRKVTRDNAKRFRLLESATEAVVLGPDGHYQGGQGMPCPAINGPVQKLSQALLAAKYEY